MILLDKLLASGLRFVLERVAEAVDAETDDATTLREELLAAQMRLELGELDEEEFRAVERDVLARLRELRTGEQGPIALTGPGEEISVDVRFGSDDEPQ